jgi:hypothetical protein
MALSSFHINAKVYRNGKRSAGRSSTFELREFCVKSNLIPFLKELANDLDFN